MILAPLVVAGASDALARGAADARVAGPTALRRGTNQSFAALPANATADPRVAAAGPGGGRILHREGLAPRLLAGGVGAARAGLGTLAVLLSSRATR